MVEDEKDDSEVVISLSSRETELLLTMLDNPPAPNKALVAAFERRNKLKVDNG